MENHHGRTMRIVPSRLCLAFGILAHQPTPTMFVLVSADKDLVAKTDLLTLDSPPNVKPQVFKSSVNRETRGCVPRPPQAGYRALTSFFRFLGFAIRGGRVGETEWKGKRSDSVFTWCFQTFSLYVASQQPITLVKYALISYSF